MVPERRRLPDRRASESFNFMLGSFVYVATISRFNDGTLAEIFLGNGKAGSASDGNAKEVAIIATIALQFGVPVDVIRHAVLRDDRGRAAGPLGMALEILARRDG
jgi:hypothetical protein